MSDDDKRQSIFADDWRKSLQAHYEDVVRRDDTLTEQTLIPILLDVGFREDELRDIKLRATMRADAYEGDGVPDLTVAHDHGHGHDHAHDHGHGHDHAHDHETEPHTHDEPPAAFAGVDVPQAAHALATNPPDEDLFVDDPLAEPDAVVGEGEMLVAPESPGTEAEAPGTDEDTPDDADPDAPQQMSMF